MDKLIEVNQILDADDHIRDATLRRIRHYLSDREQRVYPDLKGMCERVSDTYRDRVVVELLQNAHDAHEARSTNGRIKIILDSGDGPFGSLTVANDGIGFLQKNFDALCSPTLTTKSVNEAIGNKGVGFLSVFQVSSFPEIYSRVPGSSDSGFDGYCFRFADDESVTDFLRKEEMESDADDVIANMPRLYLACPSEVHPADIERLADEGFATAVRLPLKNAESLLSVKEQIAQLAEGDPPIQLFLSRIAEFSIECSEEESTILTRRCDLLKQEEAFRMMEVRCDEATFIVAERTIPHLDVLAVIEADVAAERLPESWRKWEGDAIVSLAVTATGTPLMGRLYNFLPMGTDAKSSFDGHLDAPFYASIDRLKLQSGVKLNEMFLAVSRELAVEAARAAKNGQFAKSTKEVVSDFLFWHGDGRAKNQGDFGQHGRGARPRNRIQASKQLGILTGHKALER